MLETGLRVPFLRIKREAGPVTPLVAESIISCICVGGPWFEVLTADDVHYSTHGIRAVESRRSTFHDLNTTYVVEVQTVVVYVVHRLTRHTFAIHEEEHGITPEATHIERCLLTHGEAELQSGHLLREHILDIGGIDHLDVAEGDESRHHRGVLQGLRGIGSCDHNRIQLHRVAEGSLVLGLRRECNSWHDQGHAS